MQLSGQIILLHGPFLSSVLGWHAICCLISPRAAQHPTLHYPFKTQTRRLDMVACAGRIYPGDLALVATRASEENRQATHFGGQTTAAAANTGFDTAIAD
jgi:hypothetical protein